MIKKLLKQISDYMTKNGEHYFLLFADGKGIDMMYNEASAKDILYYLERAKFDRMYVEALETTFL